MSTLIRIKSKLGANSHRHLLVHLGSSLVHLVVSLILTFYWKQADVRSSPSVQAETIGVTVMFGTLTLAYSVISAVKFAMAVGHFCFKPKSQRTITLTILATSGASTILAIIAILIIGLLSFGVGAVCFEKIPHMGTVVVLNVSIALNALLFSTSLIEWKQQSTVNEAGTSDGVTRTSAVAGSPVFCPTTLVSSNRCDSPVPVPLYPSDQLGSMISFDKLTDFERNL